MRNLCKNHTTIIVVKIFNEICQELQSTNCVIANHWGIDKGIEF